MKSETSFSLGDGPVISILFGELCDIFANNVVISPWQAKHASVCLLIPHKRTANSFVLIHKQRQTFPLLCRLFFLFLLFFPLPLWAQEGRTHTLTPEQAWRSLDHTQSCARISPWLSFFFFFLLFLLFHSFCITLSVTFFFPVPFHISPSLCPAWPRQSRGCVPTVACLYRHSSTAFCLYVCLNMLMGTVERMVT